MRNWNSGSCSHRTKKERNKETDKQKRERRKQITKKETKQMQKGGRKKSNSDTGKGRMKQSRQQTGKGSKTERQKQEGNKSKCKETKRKKWKGKEITITFIEIGKHTKKEPRKEAKNIQMHTLLLSSPCEASIRTNCLTIITTNQLTAS